MPTVIVHCSLRAILLLFAVSLIVYDVSTATAFSTSAKCRTATLSSTGAHTLSSCVSQYMTMSSNVDDGTCDSTTGAVGRRAFSKSLISTASALTVPAPALAKGKEPITAEMVKAAFDAVRFELEDDTGVVAQLERLVQDRDYEAILEFTKESDAKFRKFKMGRARKLLTDNKLKDEAVLMCNAVTFDLIGVNRASRPGKENTEEAMKYLEELRKDIANFLALEGTIEIPAASEM